MSIKEKTPSVSEWIEDLNEKYFDLLCNVARAQLSGVNRQHLAEDIVQTAILMAHEQKESLIGQSNIKGWLYKVTFNLCRNEIRKGTRHRKRVAFSIDEDGAPEIIDTYAEREIYRFIEVSGAADALHYLRNHLKSAEFDLLTAKYIDKRITKDLCAEYGISECAMDMRLLRIRRKSVNLLKEYFDKYC